MMSANRFAARCGLPSVRSLVLHLAFIAGGVVFSVVGALVLIEDKPPGVEPASMRTTLLLIVPMLLILLVRRRYPLSVLVVSTAFLVVVREIDVPELQVTSLAWVVALYSAGRYGGRWRNVVRGLMIGTVAATLLWEVIQVAGDVEEFGFTQRSFALTAGANIAWNIAVFVGAWFAADMAVKRQLRERELAARSLELEASRDENARRAVMDERVRIAREIHDVVAHHVSVMGVQAGAARRALAADPSKAEAPLVSIEESSREAVGELHRLLGFLRRVDETDPDGLDPGSLSPRPSLERLAELRRQLADAGLALRLSITGEERPLPPSVDLTAYRILQEALTNTLKYAGVDTADVEIGYRSDHLRLSVRDRGRGASSLSAPSAGGAGLMGTGGGGGAGLMGMAERVALLGGRLDHGNRVDGGFEVMAELPYSGAAIAAPSTSAAGDTVRPEVAT